jgi:hypothetical protein
LKGGEPEGVKEKRKTPTIVFAAIELGPGYRRRRGRLKHLRQIRLCGKKTADSEVFAKFPLGGRTSPAEDMSNVYRTVRRTRTTQVAFAREKGKDQKL